MDVEHWTIKKVDHQRNYTFEHSSWQRLLRVPWTARRSNKSFLKEINPEYSLEGWMLKLKSPDAKSQLIGKDPDAGKDRGKKGVTEDEMVGWHHRLNGHEFEQTQGDSEGQGNLLGCIESDRTERLKSNIMT